MEGAGVALTSIPCRRLLHPCATPFSLSSGMTGSQATTKKYDIDKQPQSSPMKPTETGIE